MSKSQDVSCLFCGEVPCVCEGKSSKKKTPRKNAFRKAVTPEEDLGSHDGRSSSGSQTDSSSDPFEEVEIPKASPRFRSTGAVEHRDLSAEAAFRSLLPILGQSDKARVQNALRKSMERSRTRTLKATRDWRRKNGI